MYYCCCYLMSHALYINIVIILLYPVTLRICVATGIGALYFVLTFFVRFLGRKKILQLCEQIWSFMCFINI